jgi:hypothetical protein
MALDGVDDGGVLVDVRHRQARQVDACPNRMRQPLPLLHALE